MWFPGQAAGKFIASCDCVLNSGIRLDRTLWKSTPDTVPGAQARAGMPDLTLQGTACSGLRIAPTR